MRVRVGALTGLIGQRERRSRTPAGRKYVAWRLPSKAETSTRHEAFPGSAKNPARWFISLRAVHQQITRGRFPGTPISSCGTHRLGHGAHRDAVSPSNRDRISGPARRRSARWTNSPASAGRPAKPAPRADRHRIVAVVGQTHGHRLDNCIAAPVSSSRCALIIDQLTDGAAPPTAGAVLVAVLPPRR